MNLPHRLHHSYPSLIQSYARSLCTKIQIDSSRAAAKNNQPLHHTNHNYSKKKMVTYPRRFRNIDHITEEQKHLIIEKILTQTSTHNVLYSKEQRSMNNAYINNLIIDMVYTTYCETGRGIALYDSQFNMKWKKFIVRKFAKIFSPEQLTQLMEKLTVLPDYLSNYTQRIKYFILYEYDRISFKKPVYIYPSESFMLSWNEFSKHNEFNNTLNALHNQRNPNVLHNKMMKNEQELYHRMAYLFEKQKYKKGLYSHELASVFHFEHGSVLSLESISSKRSNNQQQQQSVELMALTPQFEQFYQSFSVFDKKVSLRKLVENAGLLYCDNQHISRVMVFSNTLQGRFQNALCTVIKDDDYLHTFKWIKTKLKENYPDLCNETKFDRATDITFTRNILQNLSSIVHIYRIPTINRYDEGDDLNKRKKRNHSNNPEMISDLYDLRYQRRYPHSLRVFNKKFNEKIYDLVRSVCMKRMMRYDQNDFIIANHGVRISEFYDLWQMTYPDEMFPFLNNEYALFHHLIEFQSHNIRALPINNDAESSSGEEWESMEGDIVEFSGTLIAGSNLLSSARSLYNRAHKMYYCAYQFVPVQPYNNQTHSRLLELASVLHNEYLHKHNPESNKNFGNDEGQSEGMKGLESLRELKREYIKNITHLLKTFRNDGIPLSDFARLYEFRYHNINNRTLYGPLTSFNPAVIATEIDSRRNLLNVGEIHRSLSNLLVVWGALITPKTKPIQQEI